MTLLTLLLIFILIAIVFVQLSKVNDLSSKIRGEEEVNRQQNDRTALWLMVFCVVFLVGCVASAIYYKNVMLGYGPHESASAHGYDLDSLFNITLFFTGIVFVITHIYLFWFSYKYREETGRKAYFFPHNTQLEIIWTAIPFAVLVFLVVRGLQVWNEVMPDLDPSVEYLEIEATGFQFGWDIRYPGPDGKLGSKNFRKISGTNSLGLNWDDPKNIDDFMPSEIVIPKGKKVRVRINSKDVLHNFYLPHFRVKMDAVPGLPTYFHFTPVTTTEEYRQRLREYPEWNTLHDPDDPSSPLRWEAFNYELACAELCGNGHWSMRRIVRVVEPEEYEEWAASQESYFMQNIRGTDDDPFKGKLLGTEISTRAKELTSAFETAMKSDESAEKTLNLEHVFFETGSAVLQNKSKFELDNLAGLLTQYASQKIEVGGHTDSVGDDTNNMRLSQSRAQSVVDYLSSKGVNASNISSKGYGETKPVETNDTDEGRQKNRRTEITLKS